jgi:hypothetical protein
VGGNLSSLNQSLSKQSIDTIFPIPVVVNHALGNQIKSEMLIGVNAFCVDHISFVSINFEKIIWCSRKH